MSGSVRIQDCDRKCPDNCTFEAHDVARIPILQMSAATFKTGLLSYCENKLTTREISKNADEEAEEISWWCMFHAHWLSQEHIQEISIMKDGEGGRRKKSCVRTIREQHLCRGVQKEGRRPSEEKIDTSARQDFGNA